MFLRDTCNHSLYLLISIEVYLLLLFSSCPETINGAMIVAKRGVVATDQAVCSQIGRDILQRGGHAVDAAVASAFCLGVACPSYSGIGGGGFMLVRSSTGKSNVFDMREMAPGRSSKDIFGSNYSKISSGPLSIAVPGQLAGLYTAHKTYGKIPWGELVKPAENLARNGFNISEALFKSINTEKQFIMADKELRSIFAPKGKLLCIGNTIRLVKLADTLAAISKQGMNVFYSGYIAKSLSEDIQKAGGIITKNDFQKYRVITREPLVADAMGHQIVTAPPPASGGAVLILILKILYSYNATNVPTWIGIHRFVEALKISLSLKTNLGDPGFVNTTRVLNEMISTEYANRLQNLIKDNKTFDPSHYGSKNWSPTNDHGTTHVCVVDKERNVVSMTMSLNSHFGSRMVSPSTGIFLNNQMYDFSVPAVSVPLPAPSNFIKRYKRPLSSMTPAIFLKGKQVRAVIGASGGFLIPDAVVEVLVNYFNLKMDPLQAVVAPRLYHMLYPDVLYQEDCEYKSGLGYDSVAYSEKLKVEMRKRGHVVKKAPGWTTVCQFVVQELVGPNAGQLTAISDPRKGGSPAGY